MDGNDIESQIGSESSTESLSDHGSTGSDVILDDTQFEYYNKQLAHLSHVLWHKSLTSNAKASLYRLFNLIMSLAIIVISISVGAYEALQEEKNIPVIIVMFAIAGIKSIYQYLGVGKKGIYYKRISLRLKAMSNNAAEGARVSTSVGDVIGLIDVISGEMHDLDMESYKISYEGDIRMDVTGKSEAAAT